jgi:hypothetical protein
MVAAHGEPQSNDPAIAPNAGSPLSSQICVWDFEQRLTKEARSFHTVWNVCAMAIPFHLQDHVFGSAEYLYGDYPNEAGPKATRSEIGVIPR